MKDITLGAELATGQERTIDRKVAVKEQKKILSKSLRLGMSSAAITVERSIEYD
jgi:hypothetical protein